MNARRNSNLTNWLTLPEFKSTPEGRVKESKQYYYELVEEKFNNPLQGVFAMHAPNDVDKFSSTKSNYSVPDDDSSHFTLSFKDYKGFKTVDEIKELYEFKKELGSGSFATVYHAINKLTEREVAIKVLKKSLMQKHPVYEELLRQELYVLEITDHPHITKVYEILED